ncbi:MAG: alkaline phosphatase family protein [Jatrophihabitantaceae bacterium]
MPMIRPLRLLLAASTMTLFGVSIAPLVADATDAVPRPDHVVVVVMENHSNTDVIGNSAAPYINTLAATGANFSQSYAITHPSQPNYLALFSGSTQGVTDNSCPHTFSTANLGSELIANSSTFKGYAESMPYDGYTGCSSGAYARKHNPWVNWTNIPATSNLTLDAFPTDYNELPTVSMVVPNLDNDMHDGTVAEGDAWLRDHFDSYAQWAKTHNSLLVLTFDEDDNSSGNRIPTVFVGASVKPGLYSERIDHYDVLRTLEDAYDLPHAGASASATPITDVWVTGDPTTPPPPDPDPVCLAAQLIVNPGFETGLAFPWTASTGVVMRETAAQQAWGGSWLARLGGDGVSRTDTLSQTVSIPATCTATLSFWLNVDTAEKKRSVVDTLKVSLRSATGSVQDLLATYSNRDAASGYEQYSFDVSEYAGSQVTVTFTGTENSGRTTSFLLDYVRVRVS